MIRLPDDNPAHRLETILSRYGEVMPNRRSAGYDAVWVETLQLDGPHQVTVAVAQAFSLIPEIAKALATTGDPAYARLFRLYVHQWSKPFIPTDSGRSQQVRDADVSGEAMAVLSGIASHLRDNLPEGTLLDEETISPWREQVVSLIQDLQDGQGDLPRQVRALLIARLHDMLWALDHLNIMGTEGVRAATERLTMAYHYAHHEAGNAPGKGDEPTPEPTLARINSLLKGIYEVLQAPGALYATVELLTPTIQAITN